MLYPRRFFFAEMYICYLDESGTIEAGSSSSHFVLLGCAILATTWKAKDVEVAGLKAQYGLENAEIHTGWMLRPFPEQNAVPDFAMLNRTSRRKAVLGVRAMNLARPRTNSAQKEIIKNYRKTESFIHLTFAERIRFLEILAELVGNWSDCRLFADAHDKRCSFGDIAFEHAFEQIVTRLNTFLAQAAGETGILVQDHNETVCKKLTEKMREFHRRGTLWSSIENIVETPLFVDSQLTSMVQIADLCAFATRRFFEKGETRLFDRVYDRFDRHRGKLVGLRHYTGVQHCLCRVCIDHGRN